MNTVSRSKHYRTRDGLEVSIYTTQSLDAAYPVVGAIRLRAGGWTNHTWTRYGGSIDATGDSSRNELPNDLVESEPYGISTFVTLNAITGRVCGEGTDEPVVFGSVRVLPPPVTVPLADRLASRLAEAGMPLAAEGEESA